ncbi:MAG: bifunctional UDP-N-acetylglucosamine diphosphorylase/glucosamine-1-phosphate N-acetyltransferase GlmU [Mycobacteriaceae bacterium]
MTSPSVSPSVSTPDAVVVLAAGAGTRMRSALPKVLHRIAGRTLLEHAVRAAAATGAPRLVVVLGHEREQVARELDLIAERLQVPITTAVQAQQRGTGDAVAAALDALGDDLQGSLLVTSADVPLLDAATLTALHTEHTTSGFAVTVLTTVVTDPTGYGRVLRGSDGSVQAIVEHADADPEQQAVREVNSSVYAFDVAVLRAGLDGLSTDNAQGELYLPDVLALARVAGHRVGALTEPDPWLVAGANDRAQLAELGAELNRRLLHGWMRAGVTIIDPTSTWVDCDTELAPDVELRPGVQLHGVTRIATGAVIGPDCTLRDTVVEEGAQVVRTHAEGAVVGPDVTVGPFSYLRPGTVLAAGAKIGTFVETKNATVGTGSKVPHLTYVGDAEIGEHSNIGASSVFVNYDGVNKNRTIIGSHVRTGSDTMFIAPVRVGDGAYTGAGTVVRSDVPAGALAVSGGQQRTIEGWVSAKRSGTAAAQAADAANLITPTPPAPTTDENGDAL